MSGSTADQDRIEQDLGRTRARMDARLNELGERLSPGQILDDLMGYFRGSEGHDFARDLMESVRASPLPAALTGIGLTWLMASNPQPGQARTTRMGGRVQTYPPPNGAAWRSEEELDTYMRRAEQDVARRDGEAEPAYRVRLDAARAEALGVAREGQDTDDSFSKRVQDAMATARESVAQGARGLGEQASDATRRVGNAASGLTQGAGEQLAYGGQAAQQMGSNLLSAITDNPVLLGALGLAVGALLGTAVPQSDEEKAALGGIAGSAREGARNLAQDVANRGGEVAQRALEAGRDSAQAHGMTSGKSLENLAEEARSGDLATSVKQVAQDVLKAGDDALRKDGSGQD